MKGFGFSAASLDLPAWQQAQRAPGLTRVMLGPSSLLLEGSFGQWAAFAGFGVVQHCRRPSTSLSFRLTGFRRGRSAGGLPGRIGRPLGIDLELFLGLALALAFYRSCRCWSLLAFRTTSRFLQIRLTTHIVGVIEGRCGFGEGIGLARDVCSWCV